MERQIPIFTAGIGIVVFLFLVASDGQVGPFDVLILVVFLILAGALRLSARKPR